MDWGCNHDTPNHWRALSEAAGGALRRCPTCGAQALCGRYLEWSEPSAAWREAHQPEKGEAPYDRIEGDWSKPRMMPGLPWNHPNFKVTSHKEARRVCREWGLDPDRGGFISEKHRARAEEAARRNTAAALAKLSAQQQQTVSQSRSRSRERVVKGPPPERKSFGF